MADDLGKRLDRFEEKLDRVSEALIQLTRIEERQTMTANTLERVWTAIESQEQRIARVETRQGVTITSQILWSAIALLVGVIGYMLKGAA